MLEFTLRRFSLSPFIVVLAWFSSSVMADNTDMYEVPEILDCQERHNAVKSYSMCLDSVIKKYERELKTWESNIEIKLTGTNAFNGKEEAMFVFKKSKKDFEDYRARNCNWQYLAALPDVDSAGIINKECNINMTLTRINSLKEISAFEF